MKKQILIAALALAGLQMNAQTTIVDTVLTGASYANDVWYSLQNDNQATRARAEWDLAFEASGYTTAILINSGNGVELYQTNLGAADFTTSINSSSVSTMQQRHNTDTSWAYGAFNLPVSNGFDLGWGIYNQTTHIVSGDSVYVIKLANGTYKKLIIDNLNGGVYTFRYDDLTNTGNGTTATITKSTYAGKNFGYYSIQNAQTVDREPATASWDLLFTKYVSFIPTAYGVTGVLQNKGVLVQQADDIANPATSQPLSAPYSQQINTIGYDWKVFNMSSFVYEIVNDTVYFVKDKSGSIWRLRFSAFSGSSAGRYVFNKTQLSSGSTGITDAQQNNIASMAVYPNPASGDQITIIFSATEMAQAPVLSIYSLDGKLVQQEDIRDASVNQLNQYHVSTASLENGIYMVRLNIAGSYITQKLVIQK